MIQKHWDCFFKHYFNHNVTDFKITLEIGLLGITRKIKEHREKMSSSWKVLDVTNITSMRKVKESCKKCNLWVLNDKTLDKLWLDFPPIQERRKKFNLGKWDTWLSFMTLITMEIYSYYMVNIQIEIFDQPLVESADVEPVDWEDRL